MTRKKVIIRIIINKHTPLLQAREKKRERVGDGKSGKNKGGGGIERVIEKGNIIKKKI